MQTSHERVNAALDDGELDAPAEQVRELLEDQVPLTLLMDLTSPDGPASQHILDDEGVPEQAWWQQD